MLRIYFYIASILLLSNACYGYILLIADIDDFQNLAKQINSSDILRQLQRIWRGASNEFKMKITSDRRQTKRGFPYDPEEAPGKPRYLTGVVYPVGNAVPPYGYGVLNTNQFPPSYGGVKWVPMTRQSAAALSGRAVVAGYEPHNSPLWVIRAHFEGDVIPGKLAVNHRAAYVAWGGKENPVKYIEVCCALPDCVRWVESSNGAVPPGAVIGGRTSSGEILYIGRARQQGSLTPGKVHSSHNCMYISFAGNEVPHKNYEVLVTV